MFPPYALVLFFFVMFLLCFPFGKLPLSFLTLKKRLNFGEQDTGQGPHLVKGHPGAVIFQAGFCPTNGTQSLVDTAGKQRKSALRCALPFSTEDILRGLPRNHRAGMARIWPMKIRLGSETVSRLAS